MAQTRQYLASATSTETFGRMIGSARHNHFVVDGPVQNDAPGVAVTPPELFLGGVATCAVELIQSIGLTTGVPVASASARVSGTLGSGQQHHPGVTVFDSVEVDITLGGVSREEAVELVEAFKSR